MADEHLNPKMRRNPLAYQGWEYVDNSLDNISKDIDMHGYGIVNLRDPQNDQDAATKKYVDDVVAAGGGGGGGPLNASNIRSTGTGQIAATNVQAAINEISTEAAFVDRSNTFQEIVTFQKIPQLVAGANITQPQELTTLSKVNELIAGINVKAADVSVDQTNPLTNIKGTDVQSAIEEMDDLFGEISDFMVESTSLVGTYDATKNQVIAIFGGGTTGGLQASQPLPTPADENKGMYVLVTVAGTGVAPAPAVSLSAGDLIFSTGALWTKISTALPAATITAAEVTFNNATTQFPNNPATVQEAIQELNAKIPGAGGAVNATNVAFTSNAGIQATNVAGALDELKTASGNFLTKDNGQLTGNLDANNQRIIGLANPQLDQDAINKRYADSAYLKLSGGQLTGALSVGGQKITNLGNPTDGTDSANKQYVDNQILASGGNYVTKTGGQLIGPLDANNQKITKLATPTDPTDTANKKYVDDQITTNLADYVTKTGGQLTGPLDANNQKITNLAAPTVNSDTANKQYVDGQITTNLANYVTKDNGQLTGPLNAGGQKITNLGAPTTATDTANKQYVDQSITTASANYVTKVNGVLDGDLNANSKKITNLADPQNPQDASSKQYVDNQGANYITKQGGQLGSDLNAAGFKITGLGNGADDSDAINVGQLKAALQAISSQLIGKLTFIGTYNANANQIASLSPAAVAFQEYKVNQPLPADQAKFTNHFLIVTVAGTGTAPAPTEALKVGDLLYSSGSGWGVIPLGSTHTAVNIAVDAITQLPGVANVQDALSTLAQRPVGPFSATETTFDNTTASLPNSPRNVQAAIEGLNTKANGFDAIYVKQAGGQLAGVLNAGGYKITNLGDPAVNTDTANKQYVDTQITTNLANYVTKANGQLAGALNAATNKITNLGDPTDPKDTANKQYVDGQITASLGDYVAKANGQLAGNLDANNQKITNLAAPTADTDTANKQYVDGQITTNLANYVTKVNGALGGNLNADNHQINNLGDGVAATDAINLRQLNTAIQAITHPVFIESLNNVNITASIASLVGKGLFTLSSRLLRDSATKDTLSALFAMKLVLTAGDWVPGNSNTPTPLAGCQINGDEYFKGLPLPIDTTLTGGDFKTLAQIALISVVPTGGVNLPQNQTPIRIGRLVCSLGMSGNDRATKIAIVFNSTSAVPIPTGPNAFYIMRYEGLPTMSI